MHLIDGILVEESQNPVQLENFRGSSRLILCDRFTDIVQIRSIIIQKVNCALEILPKEYGLMIYESFRPRSRQFILWNKVFAQIKQTNPDISESETIKMTEIFVSNPYKFGSGHQAAAAIDVTLCDPNGNELDMGTPIQEFNFKTRTDCADLPEVIKKRRLILKSTLEQVGLVNYPAEWWHFSYGDRLWAEVTNRNFAFFAPID